MTEIVRARYTLEFKREAVRLVRGGQSLTWVSRGLGVSAQSIDNRVKVNAVGGLKEAKGKLVNADQMQIAQLKAELSKMNMERDILKSGGILREGAEVMYAFIERHEKVRPIATQCRVLAVSASG